MTTKTTPTIAAAEKRVIKHEMRTLGRAYRKILADAGKAGKSARREILAAERKFDQTLRRIDKSVARETKAIERRMAILEGRL